MPVPNTRPQSSTHTTEADARQLVSTRTAWIAALLLAAAVFAIYSPALNFQFILDDHRFSSDPRLQFSGHLWEYFTSYVWAQTTGAPNSFYRPIFVLWMRTNHILTGTSPWGWHLLSILKHELAAFLLGLLVWKLLRDRMSALMAATLFALHPAQTESVAWTTVPDPLMSAGVLGALLLLLKYFDRPLSDNPSQSVKSSRKSRKQNLTKPGESPSPLWIVASALVCLAAQMAKETAVIIPAIVFVAALLVPFPSAALKERRKTQDPDARTRVLAALRNTAPFIVVTVIYFLFRIAALDGHISPPTQHLPWTTVILSWPATLWFYLKVLFWPVQPRAFADPTLVDAFSLRGVLLPALGVGCALILLVSACVWMWRKSRRSLPPSDAQNVQRALLLGISILVLPILLTLNLNALNPGDFLHGRYTYLPLAGLMLILAVHCRLAKGKQRMIILSAAALIVMAFGLLTWKQEGPFKDDMTVFTVAHQYAPHNQPVAQNLMRAHVQVALGQADEDQCDEAMPVFNDAIRQFPEDWYAWAGRGECLYKLHDLPGAEQSLHRASDLSHDPRVTEQWHQLREEMGLTITK